MAKYLWQRLKPFFYCFIVFQIISVCGKIFQTYQGFDYSLLSLLLMLGSLALTSVIAFMHMMIPFLLFLMFLPQKRLYGKGDKIFTTLSFFVFVYANLFGVVAEQIFWDEFQSAFNFIAVDYLVYTTEVVENIYQSYPVNWLLFGILVVTLAIMKFGYKYLFPAVEVPRFGRRLAGAVIYVLVLVGAYHGVDMSRLEWGKNYYNNEAGKQGTFSLFSAFLKNEIDYKTFYPVQDKAKNMEILRSKFGGKNVTFVEPEESIERKISSPKKKIAPM